MELKIQRVSTEIIKPSSPTPRHLLHHHLSYMDQISPQYFMPMFFFYQREHPSGHLKSTLSDTLTLFYPLAGHVVDNLFIDCNDHGVPYVEARCSSQLLEVIENPNPNELNKLLPCELTDFRGRPLVIQTTFFQGGGMAIAIGLSHKIADMSSLVMFVNNWAGISRGDRDHVVPPIFESTKLFPPVEIEHGTEAAVKENIITRIFRFSVAKISALREKYAAAMAKAEEEGDGEWHGPTRVEALTAFIWSRFVAATETKIDSSKLYMAFHAVNLRRRMEPALPNNYFGNISGLAKIVVHKEENDDLNGGIIRKMRSAICGIDGDYVKKLKEEEKERGGEANGVEVVWLYFSSFCRFPTYEADFGLGKPTWVASASMFFKNFVVFMDGRSGEGIEVWMNLKEEDMNKLEMDQELDVVC